ncbi:chemotaxis response regulator protein-glutamate methylesterase [Rhodobacteraceae bacterium RKSG542]|nr:chemotaxis response regulator protein-glutamate methylesterase [Pseudovibrio flavus]
MIVDDSVVIRGLISRWIEEEPDLEVVARHRNGQLAVEDIESSNPDIVVLDIEMPVMDGLTALPLLLKKKRGLTVLMASTLTRRNAEISLRALSLGATDYVAKPESTSQSLTSTDFRRELIEKLRHLGAVNRAQDDGPLAFRRMRKMRAETSAGQRPSVEAKPAGAIDTRSALRQAKVVAASGAGGYELRPYSSAVPRVLTIGSSTGGPQALQVVLSGIGASIKNVPILITQHMPPTFTTILAEHLGKVLGIPSKEAEDGEVIQAGHVYVAPGGYHLRVAKKDGQVIATLDQEPPINFCRPSVDPMFDSVAEVYGAATLAVVLTGMGADGSQGTYSIAGRGGSVIAQDQKSSVVWGMPGAAAKSGNCSGILPLEQIGSKVSRLLEGTFG